MTLTLPKSASVDGPMRLVMPGASVDSLLLTVTASSLPQDEVIVLIVANFNI